MLGERPWSRGGRGCRTGAVLVELVEDERDVARVEAPLLEQVAHLREGGRSVAEQEVRAPPLVLGVRPREGKERLS